jgi:enoyl-CoA hydratase
MSDPVIVEVRGQVAWIRLNRPEALNALSPSLVAALDEALAEVEAAEQVRVVVLTGTGRAFCAGADLRELADGEPADAGRVLAFVRRAGAVVERLAALPKPVIAAVNGVAVAGGLELVLACDLVLAADDARIGDGHANYGLLPGAGGAARLVRVVGPPAAKYLAFTGELLSSSRLERLGLVNEALPGAELHDRAAELAQRIAAKSPSGLRHFKRLIDDGAEQPLATALRMEHLALEAHARNGDMREGLTAFLDRRTPRFSGTGAAHDA